MSHALAQALHTAGLSQSELGRRLGIHPSQVNRWIARTLTPTVEQLEATMRELGVVDPTTIGYRLEYRAHVVEA